MLHTLGFFLTLTAHLLYHHCQGLSAMSEPMKDDDDKHGQTTNVLDLVNEQIADEYNQDKPMMNNSNNNHNADGMLYFFSTHFVHT